MLGTHLNKLFFAALAAAGLFAWAGISEAKMTHKWDEESYARGEFKVKKHNYPPKKDEPAPPRDYRPLDSLEHKVHIDYKGRLHKKVMPVENPPIPKQ